MENGNGNSDPKTFYGLLWRLVQFIVSKHGLWATIVVCGLAFLGYEYDCSRSSSDAFASSLTLAVKQLVETVAVNTTKISSLSENAVKDDALMQGVTELVLKNRETLNQADVMHQKQLEILVKAQEMMKNVPELRQKELELLVEIRDAINNKKQ